MLTKLKIATCQFPISSDIKENSRYIQKQIIRAAKQGSSVVHFSECALSGYLGVDLINKIDQKTLNLETKTICSLAKDLNIWIILGSTHFENNSEPTNCLNVISNEGKIVDRYDKRMLTKNDVKFYQAGNHDTLLTIEGIKIGLLICYDSSFQEMFDGYKNATADIVLLSLYNAKNKGKSFLDEVTPAILRTRAIDNNVWVIANNSSAAYSNWPTCIISPDGKIVEKLPKHKSGILYHEFPDTDYKQWRIIWTKEMIEEK